MYTPVCVSTCMYLCVWGEVGVSKEIVVVVGIRIELFVSMIVLLIRVIDLCGLFRGFFHFWCM